MNWINKCLPTSYNYFASLLLSNNIKIVLKSTFVYKARLELANGKWQRKHDSRLKAKIRNCRPCEEWTWNTFDYFLWWLPHLADWSSHIHTGILIPFSRHFSFWGDTIKENLRAMVRNQQEPRHNSPLACSDFIMPQTKWK